MNVAGASYSFRNQELAVVGGGDTAVEEAIYLTKYGSMVSSLMVQAACSSDVTEQCVVHS